MKIGLFNGAVMTNNGLFRLSDISVAKASKLVKEHGYVSAVGHQAAAEVLSDLLEVDVPRNRIQFTQEVGQLVIVLKLNQRPAEGKVLDRNQMEQIGYSLKLLERIE